MYKAIRFKENLWVKIEKHLENVEVSFSAYIRKLVEQDLGIGERKITNRGKVSNDDPFRQEPAKPNKEFKPIFKNKK